MLKRAYSVLDIKAVDERQGIIEGIASTPSPDRMGDIVEPKGAEFNLPLPLLWQHRANEPIGQVISAKATAAGIEIRAKIAKDLLPRITEAWTLIKSGLVRGLSIGFNPIESAFMRDTGGMHFLRWELLEISAVTIPANAQANIQTIKSADAAHLRAALGENEGVRRAAGTSTAGATAQRSKGANMTLKELNERRQTIAARMKELHEGCDGAIATLEAEEANEFEELKVELRSVDRDIDNLRAIEQAVRGAVEVPAEAGTDTEKARKVRAGQRIEMGKSNLPAGTRFARAVIAKAMGRGSLSDAIQVAKDRWPDTPEVVDYLKANAGTGASGNWAEQLNYPNVVGEFIELLRPATILGRLNGTRPATFNTKMVIQLGGSTVDWVGAAAAKPVGELDFDFVSIDTTKCAGIIVLTEEQIMTSNPNSEQVVTSDLVRQVSQFLDQQFIDPSVSASTGLRPASVTNGVSAVPASGATANDLRKDLKSALGGFTAANMGVSGVTAVMNSDVAMGVALLTNALGNQEFPGMTMNGGNLLGMPVIVSDNVPTDSTGGLIVLIKAGEILVADNGGVRVDVSREATLDMAGSNTPTFSLWQKNCVAFRAERFITWKKARDAAVQYISGAAYAPA